MSSVSFVTSRQYQGNIVFDRKQTKIKIRDNAFDKYYELYDAFRQRGVDIATNDINAIEDSDQVIYIDMPRRMPRIEAGQKSNVILMESPLIRPDNYEVANHRYFNKVFTWNDELADGEKYIKINCAFKIPAELPDLSYKTRFLCLIIGNKTSDHPDELYSERRKLIRWFELNHPDEFDLFGVGWNEYTFRGSRLVRAFNRIPSAKRIMYKLFGEYYPSYKGVVDSKFETLKNYRYSVCYENIKNVPGYITEKIFDAMFAACVPVYWGASNVTHHIPEECFIDRRKFSSNGDLYRYLKGISEDEYRSYIDNIGKFLHSDRGERFSSKWFARTVAQSIVGGNGENSAKEAQ